MEWSVVDADTGEVFAQTNDEHLAYDIAAFIKQKHNYNINVWVFGGKN